MPSQPRASRPFMPGYGTLPEDQGTGLLPWTWAEDRLLRSRNFWLATVGSGPTPQLSAVWGVWDGDALWFSCAVGSRKARNLRSNPGCALSTEDASDPVVLEGSVELITDLGLLQTVLNLENAKYESDIEIEFLDPLVNASFRLRPDRAYGLVHDDFTGSPTRWQFDR